MYIVEIGTDYPVGGGPDGRAVSGHSPDLAGFSPEDPVSMFIN